MMSNFWNNSEDSLKSAVHLPLTMNCQNKGRSLLSMKSKEFRLPKHMFTKEQRDSVTLDTYKNTPIKKRVNSRDRSDSSTEVSETEQEPTGLNLKSSAFHLKNKNASPSVKLELSDREEQGTSPKSELSHFGLNSDTHPKSTISNKSSFTPGKTNRNNGEKSHDSATKKPKKKFVNKHEKDRFVESYRIKKKTELCKNWELTGSCKFGSSCAFAHGESELVVKVHVSGNYKTKMCKQFHEEGYCPYGSRCQFLHLVIQKEIDKFSHCDVLKESIFQYENRKKALKSDNMLDLMVNPLKKYRLPVFEELCDEEEPSNRRTRRYNSSFWGQLTTGIQDVEA